MCLDFIFPDILMEKKKLNKFLTQPPTFDMKNEKYFSWKEEWYLPEKKTISTRILKQHLKKKKVLNNVLIW